MSERIAIVTGAARGIGAGTAVRLAADGMAVRVINRSLNGAGGVFLSGRVGGTMEILSGALAMASISS